MDDGLFITSWFVATRAIHFAACLLLFGTCAFDRLIVGNVLSAGEIDLRWRSVFRALLLSALAFAWLSGASWFVLVTIQMSGLSADQAMHPEVLALVWKQTQFGMLWKIRAMILAAITVAIIVLLLAKTLRIGFIWTVLFLSGSLSASLAWAGHGRTNGPVAWHLTADVLHLIVCGIWPVGLLPLLLLLRMTSQTAQVAWTGLATIVSRFSALSLASVALLAATGSLQGLFLVGSLANLLQTLYGRVLLLKIALFCLAVALGAINLLRLKPGLSERGGPAAGRLRRNVALELALAGGVLVAVGALGLLAPPAESTPHMHHSDDQDKAIGRINRDFFRSTAWVRNSRAGRQASSFMALFGFRRSNA